MTGQSTRRSMAGYMAMQPSAAGTGQAPVFIPVNGGREVDAGGIPARVVIDSSWDTDAPFGYMEVVEPGRLVRAHAHPWAQVSLVVDGTLVFRVGGEEHVAGAGAVVRRARNVPHAVWNPGPGPACQLELNLPAAGAEEFYGQYGVLSGAGLIGPGELARLAGDCGVVYYDDLTAEIEAAWPGVFASAGPQHDKSGH